MVGRFLFANLNLKSRLDTPGVRVGDFPCHLRASRFALAGHGKRATLVISSGDWRRGSGKIICDTLDKCRRYRLPLTHNLKVKPNQTKDKKKNDKAQN
jgi:hypothetical protein